MQILNDFFCRGCGNTTESLVDTNLKKIGCSCGGIAHKLIGMPTIKLEGITGSFPSASDKWANIRESNARIKAKRA